MSHPDDPGAGGDELLPQPANSRHRRLAYAIGAVVLVAGVLIGVLTRDHGGHPAAQPSSPPRSSSSVPADSAHATPATAPAARPSRTTVFAATLPAVEPVQLFARAANSVVHVDFAADTVTTTAIPALRSSGPVAFGVTETGAYVRPLDVVPGYFVPDDGVTRGLTGALSRGAILPGPDPESVWVEESSSAGKLLGFREVYVPTSAVTSRSLTIPAAIGRLYAPPLADGSGGVLVNGSNGTFDLRAGGAHRLRAGVQYATVLAVGDDRLLAPTCSSPARQRCPVAQVRLPGGGISPLGAVLTVSGLPTGVISPDGRTALIYQPAGAGQLVARLLDLTTGRFRGVAVTVDPDTQPGAATYSADGRWAFVVSVGGTLTALDVRTGVAQRIHTDLPVLYQLAARS